MGQHKRNPVAIAAKNGKIKKKKPLDSNVSKKLFNALITSVAIRTGILFIPQGYYLFRRREVDIMREILFRGKRISDGEWVEGYRDSKNLTASENGKSQS